MTTEAGAWQAVLTAEQQAIFGFGLVGGRLGPGDELAHQSLDTHRRRAEVCLVALRDLDVEPDPGPPAFTPENSVRTDEQARALAVELEQLCASTYAALVLQAAPAVRRNGTNWLRTSAIDQYAWSGKLAALPGLET